MAISTKTKEYIALEYAKYFGKTPTDAQIAKYAEFGKAKLISNEIKIDAGLKNAKMSKDEQIHDLYNNLFGRDAVDSELTKYKVKYLDKGKPLPINSIIKAAKKGSSDKAVYDTKKAVALFIAEKGSTTNIDLDKITEDTYKEIFDGKKLTITTVVQLKAKVDAMEDNVTGQTFMLTAGVDMGSKFVGTEKGDVFNSFDVTNPSTNTKLSTLDSLDTLDGKEGNDILNIQTGFAIASPILNLTSIETVNVKTAVAITNLDGSNWNGTNTLNVTQATAATVTAAATTDVNVSGVTGAVAVDGGKNVNVTVGATGTNTTIGATTGATGTVTVKDAAQNGAIKVDGGTDVTISASGNNAGTDTIDVGQTLANDLPTGAVKVTSTGEINDNGAINAITMGAITIAGGSTVTVTQSAGITDAQKTAALTATTNDTVTQGAINVNGGAATTSVTVVQDATVAGGNATLAVAGSTQTQTVTFNALAAGNTVTVNGLTFTAAKDLSAAEVAAAFANLTSGDTQSNTGITTNGSYTGSNAAGFTTGAVVGNTVVYSEVTNGTNAGVLTPSAAKAAGVTTPTNPTAVITTTGVTTVPGVDGKIGIDAAVVTVTDGSTTTDTIKTVTIDGFKTASSVTSDALTDLTLKNGDVNAVFTVTNAVASSSLTLNVDNITGATTSKIDLFGTTITNLTINATGKDSAFTLDANGLVDLTINATAGLNLSAATTDYATAALDNVTIKGAGAVNLGVISAATGLVSFNASANTGGVTATVNANVGTMTALNTDGYVFSAGNDVVTLSNSTVSSKVTLGAGDDIVTLATGTTVLAAVIDGGTGSDTLAMAVADANTVTSAGTSAFENKISGFEKLSLTATAAAASIDLSLFDDIDYVISAGTGVGAFTLALSNMANNGTLELTGDTSAAGDITVTMANASGNTDKFDIVTKSDTGLTLAGDIVVANVETINIDAQDTTPTVGIETTSLIVTANLAKTVNVKGSSDVDLTLTGSTLVTLIDGSSMTGALTATTAVSSSAATIKGGSGADDLTADTTNDKLYGNAGADTLTVANGANLVQLYGGEGKDTYVIGVATNSNGYATINGTKAELSGDIIEFDTAIAGMSSLAKIDNLGSTAVFQDYVNEAAKGTTADNKVAWFQLDGNTYVVQNNSILNSFENGVDAVVKITGLVDLTFNAANVLEIA